MFEDGDPEGPAYIYGNLSLVAEGDSTVLESPLRLPILEVKEFRSRQAWRLVKPLKVKDKFFPIGSPVDTGTKDKYTTVVVPRDVPEHPKYGRNPDINYDDGLPGGANDINIDNLVDVPEQVLTDILSSSSEISEEVSQILLAESATLMMSYDKASAYTEAALRDGLGVEVTIDRSVQCGISHLAKLNVLSLYANKMSALPSHIKDRFFKHLIEKVADDAHKDMIKEDKSEKYSAMLDHLAARVKKPLGASKLGGSPTVDKPEGEMTTDDRHTANERQASGVRVSRR